MKYVYVLAVKQGLMDSSLHYRLVSLAIHNYSKSCYRVKVQLKLYICILNTAYS